ncbi:hypothetical protein C4J81_18255 [Deltaproteobacteria bacterium Smac51]|nr:hypothetical protein C4J81_18255 [Deltaproteobacteria bacterium Smac51]
MATPKIEMAQLKLIRSLFACNINFRPSEERLTIGVTMKHNGEFLDEYSRAHFLQRFHTEESPNVPFTIDVEFGALFLIDPPIMPLERDHYIRRVFPEIVFPYMREYVAETTRRGGFSPLIINHTLFEDIDDPDTTATYEPDLNKWIH